MHCILSLQNTFMFQRNITEYIAPSCSRWGALVLSTRVEEPWLPVSTICQVIQYPVADNGTQAKISIFGESV